MLRLKLLLGCGLLGSSVVHLAAQDTLLVKRQDNFPLKYSLENVKSLTFPTGKIALNRLNASGDLLAVKSTKTILFKLTETPLGLEEGTFAGTFSSVRFSPNPLIGEVMSIQYEAASSGSVLIEFLNVDGGVEKQIVTQCRIGANEFLVDTQELGSGLYICRVKSGNAVGVGKIIKY